MSATSAGGPQGPGLQQFRRRPPTALGMTFDKSLKAQSLRNTERVEGSRFRFRVQGLGLQVSGFGFRGQGLDHKNRKHLTDTYV